MYISFLNNQDYLCKVLLQREREREKETNCFVNKQTLIALKLIIDYLLT